MMIWFRGETVAVNMRPRSKCNCKPYACGLSLLLHKFHLPHFYSSQGATITRHLIILLFVDSSPNVLYFLEERLCTICYNSLLYFYWELMTPFWRSLIVHILYYTMNYHHGLIFIFSTLIKISGRVSYEENYFFNHESLNSFYWEELSSSATNSRLIM